MLSSPRKPPLKTLLPSASSRLSHQVKLISSLWKIRSRNFRSCPPSITNTRTAPRTCTGGLTSSKFHSYAGSAPFGCWNHSRRSTTIWYFANAGSMCAQATQWKLRSHAANHGYSHGSGIASTSNESRWRQPWLRPCLRRSGGSGMPGSPSSQRRTLYGYICLLQTRPAHAWRRMRMRSASVPWGARAA
jgi:hypothetical protein